MRDAKNGLVHNFPLYGTCMVKVFTISRFESAPNDPLPLFAWKRLYRMVFALFCKDALPSGFLLAMFVVSRHADMLVQYSPAIPDCATILLARYKVYQHDTMPPL